MRKKILLMMVASFILAGCNQMQMGSSSAKSVATGGAGGASAENANTALERCSEPFGTLAVNEDQTANWYSWLGRYGIQSTVPALRLFAQQSNCFVVVERGSGMQQMSTERRLESSGELRQGSNFGKGQMVAADYTVTPTLLFSEGNTGSIGGAIGGMFGSVGAAIGSSISTRDAQSMLTMVDNRSGVQVAVAEGSSRAMDIGGMLGMFDTGSSIGGGLNAYKRTPEGKVVLAALMDAFNNLVRSARNYAPQKATGPQGMGTGGKLQVN